MAEQHTPSTDTPVVIDRAVTIHTVPLPSDHRVLVFVEANMSSAHDQQERRQ